MSDQFSVGESRVTQTGEVSVVSAPIRLGDREFSVWFRVTGATVSADSNAFLAATLIPAMKGAGALNLSGQVSPGLLSNSSTIQSIIHKWFPEFKKIPVTTGGFEDSVPPSGERGVGCFFSAGVDSYYTLLKHQADITHIIYVHGFDIWLHEEAFRFSVLNEIRRVAESFGKPLIFVETNIHEFSDQFTDWGLHYFGSALASVALLLAPQLRTVYVPSSCAYDELFPWGSHPLLDPMWSTESLQIVHDGSEASRTEKVTMIAQSEIALQTLRVCLDRRDGAYNCGHCEKCIRTMINLRLSGIPDDRASFNRPLDLDAVSNFRFNNEHALVFARDNLRSAMLNGDEELAAALQQAIDRFEQRLLVNRIETELPKLSRSKYWQSLTGRLFPKIPPDYRKWALVELLKEQLKDWDRAIAKGKIHKTWTALNK